MRAEDIVKKLEEVEAKENVRILYAVESGSRAWGVESFDSDYDVRFIYAGKKEDYLRLEGTRDIIEWQMDEVWDINGWDIKKALIQFHRGNATLFEWANSPIVYKTTDEWECVYESAKGYFSKKTALCHYYGTAKSTYSQYLQGEKVRYKKYIYALRPLLACKYIEDKGSVPPVRFEELLEQKLDGELAREIDKMLKIKAESDEKALNPKLPVIQSYIETEIEKYGKISKAAEDDRNSDWLELNKAFFRVLGL